MMNGVCHFSLSRNANRPDQLADQRVNQTVSHNLDNATMTFGKGGKTKQKVLTRRTKTKSVCLACDKMHDGLNQSDQANIESQQQQVKLGECQKHGLLKITQEMIWKEIAVDFALHFN